MKDGQLDPPDVEPFVGGVEQRLQQRRADAAAVQIVGDAHAEDRRMPPPSGRSMQPGSSDEPLRR